MLLNTNIKVLFMGHIVDNKRQPEHWLVSAAVSGSEAAAAI